MAGFSISNTVFIAGWKQSPMYKQNYKNARLLYLVGHIFTKLSQNVYLINKHI